MPKAKPFSGPVDPEIARQLLNSSGIRAGESLLGDALHQTAQHLADLVEQAGQTLEGNKFAQIVADHLAADLNRRGRAHLSVSETGGVVLHISYEENAPAPKVRRKRATPLMQDLKERAKSLGVDISHLGIKRTKIQKYLDDVSAKKATPPTPKPVSPPVKDSVTSGESEPGPMSAGPDETTISELPETFPPRRSFVKSGETTEGPVLVDAGAERKVPKPPKAMGDEPKGRSMRQLVQESKDVNISDLLASEPPK